MDIVADVVEYLTGIHWNGTGCNVEPDNPSACVYCYGPSPMSTKEVVETILDLATPKIQHERDVEMSRGLWELIQPITTWVAGVNTRELSH